MGNFYAVGTLTPAVVKEIKKYGIKQVLGMDPATGKYACIVEAGKLKQYDFQRDKNEKWVAQIEANYRKGSVQTPMLALLDRDENNVRFADGPVLGTGNGQHTIEVMVNMGNSEFLAMVMIGKTWDKENGFSYLDASTAFLDLNNNRSVPAWDKFRAGAKNKEMMYAKILDVIRSTPFRTPLDGPNADLTNTTPLIMAWKRTRAGAALGVKNLLTVLLTWHNDETGLHTDARRVEFQRGLNLFIAEYGDRIGIRNIIARLRYVCPGVIYQRARIAKDCKGRADQSQIRNELVKLFGPKYSSSARRKAA